MGTWVLVGAIGIGVVVFILLHGTARPKHGADDVPGESVDRRSPLADRPVAAPAAPVAVPAAPAGGNGSATSRNPQTNQDVVALRSRLRAKVLGDERKMDWLIQAERQRDSSRSEQQILLAVIERWEVENRSWR